MSYDSWKLATPPEYECGPEEPSDEAEAAEIADTIEAYEDLAKLNAPLTPAEAAAQNHADHMAYVREELRKERDSP